MKTYTEIEKLADEVYPHTDMGKLKSHIGFINGYNKCQEDMADVIQQAIEYGYQLRCNNKPINSGIDWVKEFIKPLNKGD